MAKPIIYKTDHNQKLSVTNAEQLIQLIRFLSALPEMGAETTRIKMGFQEYFQAFVNKHITEPKLREQLRSIPVEIHQQLESEETPRLAMAQYHSAVIDHILNELIQERSDKFFEEETLKKAEENLEELMKKSRIEKEEFEALEEYIKEVAGKERDIELMAILALSEAQKEMENKITQLETEQGEIFKELYAAFHEDLKGHEVFSNLQDIHGNKIVLDEHEKRELIESVVKDYTDDFVNYCAINNAIPLNAQAANPQAQAGYLNAYQQQHNDLFEQYHRENEGRLHKRVAVKLRDKNVHVEKSDPKVLQEAGEKIHRVAENRKRQITKIASNQVELNIQRFSLDEMKAVLAKRAMQQNLRV